MDTAVMLRLLNILMNLDPVMRISVIMTALDTTLAEEDMTMDDILRIREEVEEICGEL